MGHNLSFDIIVIAVNIMKRIQLGIALIHFISRRILTSVISMNVLCFSLFAHHFKENIPIVAVQISSLTTTSFHHLLFYVESQ